MRRNQMEFEGMKNIGWNTIHWESYQKGSSFVRSIGGESRDVSWKDYEQAVINQLTSATELFVIGCFIPSLHK